MNKIFYYIIAGAICICIGFFVGRGTVSIKTEIKTVLGKTVHDSITVDKLVTKYEYSPSKPIYIERNDSNATVYTPTPKDTTESLKIVLDDWNTKRIYANNLFKDSINGIFDYDITIQYNKIQNFKYEFTPVKTTITKERIRMLQPFVGVSYSTLDIVGIGGGIFYHDLGLEVLYNKNYINGDDGISFGIKYKF